MEISFKMQIQFGAGAGSRNVEAEKIWKLKNPNFQNSPQNNQIFGVILKEKL